MSGSSVRSAVSAAMSTSLCTVESMFMRGYAGVQLIGNASEVCRDGKERARAALESLGLALPPRRLVISIAPADVKKDGNHLDLPIALSLLLLLQEARTPHVDPSRWLFAAELGLDGTLRPVRGTVSFALCAAAEGLAGMIVAPENLAELQALARLNHEHFGHLECLSFAHLSEVAHWLYTGEMSLSPPPAAGGVTLPEVQREPDFDDMALDADQRRMILTVATGMHSLLLRGSPGTGKSMIARRLVSILPDMPAGEHLEALQIQSSFSHSLPRALLQGRPPYRSPHHQASAAAVLGSLDGPGEMSLAHGGVLFLDELPEFRRDIIEALREPLESGEINVSRAKAKVSWRARPLLIGAANNCPCGWSGSPRRRCRCPAQKLIAYNQKLSGPILDRIDIHFNVPELSPGVKAALFQDGAAHQQTAAMREHVVTARDFAAKRNQTLGISFNRELEARQMTAASGLSAADFQALVAGYLPQLSSARSLLRALRVSRTLADLDESEEIRPLDLSRAWAWQAEQASKARGDDIYLA